MKKLSPASSPFFVDAALFVFEPFIGVLNAITHELVLITNNTDINAESVCELLLKITSIIAAVPITLVLDNARYQKLKIAAALASNLNIELLFLLPYSPSLNLIERFGNLVRSSH